MLFFVKSYCNIIKKKLRFYNCFFFCQILLSNLDLFDLFIYFFFPILINHDASASLSVLCDFVAFKNSDNRFSAETIFKILSIIFKTIQTIQTVSVDRQNCSIKCLHTLYSVWSVLFVDHQHLFQWLFQTAVSNICIHCIQYICIILVLYWF